MITPVKVQWGPGKKGLMAPKTALMSLLVTGRERQICVKVLSHD
jgi:hypothetical protein